MRSPLPFAVLACFVLQSAFAEEEGMAFISAEQVTGQKGKQLEASGAVELKQGEQKINADHLLYEQETQQVQADGNVRLQQRDGVVSGPELKLNLGTHTGEMREPSFEFSQNHSRGSARQAQINSRTDYAFEQATYTTCPAGNDDWLLKMSHLEMDRAAQVGVAHHARVEFMGVPILYTPWMDFPLNDARRSGFLGPIFGSTNKGGSEVTLPFYWNIAPNYDATLAPRNMEKRGVQLNNEFRYLGYSYFGEAHYDVLQKDRENGLHRNRMSWKHAQSLSTGISASFDLNRVSDDAYFRDLASTVSGTSQINLVQEGRVDYVADWGVATARVQRFQTLQDPLAPVLPPYRRQPQLFVNAQQSAAGAGMSFTGEYVDFRHDTLINAQRLVLYPSVKYALLDDPGYYLIPKVGVHYTQYRWGANNTTMMPNAVRSVPIASLDTGMIFERDDSFLGNAYVQTLEPRLYYVRIPFRKQDQLPLFDTARASFNLAEIFTENRFLGSDLIGDANMVTLGATSRVIEAENGMERLRLTVAERLSFEAPKVNLGAPTGNNRSDILLGLGGKMTPALSLESLFQYNPNQRYAETYNVMARYNPEGARLLNLGYRYTRNTLRQADISGQWPLSARWHGVARMSYSLQDKRILEALAGLEYNQDCWSVRLVGQSFTSATQERSSGVFLQLELNNLMRIGSDPLDALRISVPGYTKPSSAGMQTIPAAVGPN